MSADCCSTKNHSIISVGEPASSRLKFNNPENEDWVICDIDGCVVSDASRRCDKLLTDKKSFTALIELKGRNIEAACKQLEDSFVNPKISAMLIGKRAAIVVSKTVKIPRFDYFDASMKSKFASKYKARFSVERHDRTVCPKKCCGVHG